MKPGSIIVREPMLPKGIEYWFHPASLQEAREVILFVKRLELEVRRDQEELDSVLKSVPGATRHTTGGK